MANTTLQDKMKLAATSFASNDFGAALTSFQECLEMTTNEKALRIIQTNIGATYQRMSKFEDALKAFDSALSYDDTYLQALFNKGVTLKALNKFNEALETFNKVLVSNSTYYPALCGKCEVLCSLDQFDDALETVNAAIEVEPNNPIGYDDRAFVYLKLKKFQLAIDDYNKFDDSNKNPEKKNLKAIAMTYRGHELGREGKPPEAIQMFEDVMKLAPTEERRFGYAVLLYKNDKHDQAGEQFREIIKTNENHFKACAALGTMLCEKGEYAESSKLLRKAYDGKEFDLFGQGPLMQNLAVSLVKGGKLEEGKQVFKDLIEVDPSNEIAKKALESLDGTSIKAIEKVVKKSDKQVKEKEQAKAEAVVEAKAEAVVETTAKKKPIAEEVKDVPAKVTVPPPAPEKVIKMAKPKINNAAVENERKVSVVKRKSGRSSIIAEEYLEKVDKAKQSVKEEQAQENEKKIAPVMKDNSNKNEKDDDKNTTTTTATTTTKSPSSPSSGLVYSVEQLQIGKCPAGIDMARREQYLSDAEFNSTFNMSKDKFDALPKWKRIRAKKEVGLF